MCVTSQRKIPPDGGYGWVITFACSLKKVITIPIIFNFALVLENAYDDTNVSPTEVNQVMVWRYTIEMLFSLIAGPLLQRFGYRKVAVIGSIFVFLGLTLTSTAPSFWHLVFYYSIIFGIAEAASVPAFDLALNSFFKDKRARSTGIVTFCAGVGPMFMPLLVSNLLYSYGWRYTVLLLSALSLHCLLAACLLRPIKWYAKVQPINEEIVPLDTNSTQHITSDSGKTTSIENNAAEERQEVKSFTSLSGKIAKINLSSLLCHATTNTSERNKKQEGSLQPLNAKIANDESNNDIETEHTDESPENKNNDKKNVQKIVDFFDLTLLKDPIFVNILCGLCIGPCVEVSFSLMLPIILKDMTQFETDDVAKLMSVIAFSDIVFRLLGPYITEPWSKSPRVIYVVCLLASIATRTAMIFTNTFNGMIYVALTMGISKGIRSTYFKVIIPDYVPVNRLAYAFGLVRFFRGVTALIVGEISLHLRKTTASYKIPIVILNVFTFITIFMWTMEFLYFKLKKTRSKVEKVIE